MFCPQCGKENDPDARFCVFCGSEIADTQPDSVSLPVFLFSWCRAGCNQIDWKFLSKFGKGIKRRWKAIAVCAATIVLAAGGFAVCGNLYAPEAIARHFFQNVMDADWEAVYRQIYLPDSPFLSLEAFRETNNLGAYPTEYLNYTIQEEPAGDNTLYRQYVVEYSVPSRSTPVQMEITLVRSGRKFLFFDRYHVLLEDLLAEDCKVHLPDGGQLLVDGIAIETQSDPYGDVVLPMMFAGLHTFTLEHPAYWCRPVEMVLSSGSEVDLFSACQVDADALKNADMGDVTAYAHAVFQAAGSGEDLQSTGIPVASAADAYADMASFQNNLEYRQERIGRMELESVTLDEIWVDHSDETVTCTLRLNGFSTEEDAWEGSGSFTLSYLNGQWQLVRFSMNI